MAFDNTNRGVLFKNEDKTDENHPDYKGRINSNGTDYWLSAWIKQAKDGRKYMSLSVKPMEQQTLKQRTQQAVRDIPDDLPFDNPYKGWKSYVV